MKEIYLGDKRAIERLKNNTVCVLEDDGIRNKRDSDHESETIDVYVQNWDTVEAKTLFIDKGEYVRYSFNIEKEGVKYHEEM